MSKHAGGRPSKREEIKNWLLEYIAKATTGMRLATDVKTTAARNGYGVLSLKRAKRDAGIQSKKLADCWLWYNPLDVREDVAKQTAAVERLAEHGTALVKSVIERDEQKKHAQMNKTGWNDVKIRQVAEAQIRNRLSNGVPSLEALEQAIIFLQDQAKRNPVYPAFTDDDVAHLVIQEYGPIREKAERKLSAVNSTPNPER